MRDSIKSTIELNRIPLVKSKEPWNKKTQNSSPPKKPFLETKSTSNDHSHNFHHSNTNSMTSNYLSSFRGPSTPLELCFKQSNNFTDEGEEEEYNTSENIDQRIARIVQNWGHVIPMHPREFLIHLLTSRGYDTTVIPFGQSPNLRR